MISELGRSMPSTAVRRRNRARDVYALCTRLVCCHQDGRMYRSDGLNWQFGPMTKRAGIGHWQAHEGRHTAVSMRPRRPLWAWNPVT